MNKTSFLKTCEYFEQIEKTSSRNEMNLILIETFKNLSVEEVVIFSYLLDGRVAPYFIPVEFSFAEKNLLNVLNGLAEIKNLQIDVNNIREKIGDIGKTSYEVISQLNRETQISFQAGLIEIYETLWNIINIKGKNSVILKGNIVADLLMKMTPLEAKYFSRIITGNLRLGCSIKTFLDAISIYISDSKELREELDYAYGMTSDTGYLVQILLNDKDLDLAKQNINRLEPLTGIPIFPRLVDRVGSIEEGFEKLSGQFYVEPKYDGVRCQIHIGVDYNNKDYAKRIWSKYVNLNTDKGQEEGLFSMNTNVVQSGVKQVELFSRNLERFTDMFPEIVEEAKKIKCENCILDCEVIGIKEDVFSNFQDTMKRRRKYDIEKHAEEIPVKAYVFDILLLNGNNLINVDLVERKRELVPLLGQMGKEILIAPFEKVTNVDDLNSLYEKYISEGYEGIIIKKLEGGYKPGVRNNEWIKLKRSLNSKVVDTVDLVILGYYAGSGKQTKFGMGALLAGVYDKTNDAYVPVTKIGTGITEEQWEIISKRLFQIESKAKPKTIENGKFITPSGWIRPEIVVTVEADEITKSNVYTAGSEKLGFGLALRFPRLMEFGRDKLPTDCTSVEELVEMYKIKNKV